MNIKKTLAVIWGLSVLISTQAFAAQEHIVNAEVRAFNPDIIYIQSGDTVRFINMASHDSVSVEGLIPEGAEHWQSGIGNNITLKLDVEGVYAYACVPHIGFGMFGVIVVGEPVGIDAAMEYARANLKGPYRRLIGKLLKVQRAAKKG